MTVRLTLCCIVVTREALCLTYVCCCRHFVDPPVHVIHWLSSSCKPAGAAILLQVTGTETRPTAEPEGKGHQRRQVVVEHMQPGEAQAKTICGHKVTTQAGNVCVRSPLALAMVLIKPVATNIGGLCWSEPIQPHPELDCLFLSQTCLLALG